LIHQDIQFGNVFYNALKALLLVLEKDFQDSRYELTEIVPAIGASFLSNCGTCSTPESPKTHVSR